MARLWVTTGAQTKALQKIDALHANTVVIQKNCKNVTMKEFYTAVDGVTKELSSTVLNDICSVSPQGATVIVQVKLQASRKRIFDKIQMWIAMKGKNDVMMTWGTGR